jgi:hypothetical protein
MSRRGDCWDNAVAEGFFATLKVELVHDTAWATRAGARTDLFDYLELFYNGQPRHSAQSRRKHLALAANPGVYETGQVHPYRDPREFAAAPSRLASVSPLRQACRKGRNSGEPANSLRTCAVARLARTSLACHSL